VVKRLIGWITLLVSLGFLFACKSNKVAEASFSDLDGRWDLVELNGKPLASAETNPFIELDLARHVISGKAGCNRMMGKVEYNQARKHIIRFLEITTTRMACPNMNLEREFLEALERVVRFEANDEIRPVRTIAFYGADNTRLMVINKR
jgi:heat shock protein HslJ